MKITDAVHEFILYKQSLGMTYKNRALKLTAFARLAEQEIRFRERIRGSSGPISTPWKKCRR